jgi:predicted acyltransferase
MCAKPAAEAVRPVAAPRVAPVAAPARIASIDALRGFDLFWITGGYRLVAILGAFFTIPDSVLKQMDHVQWEGFSAWDLIMPLFLFIVGAAMPFSFGKRLEEGQSRKQMWLKIIRRVLILWLFGMIVQGNLLAFNSSKLYLFSNTLQAIAVGYLVASLALMYLPLLGQLALTCVLLAGFWLLMMLVPSPGCPAGTMEEARNLARFVDDFVLRCFCDRSPGYAYTWVLSGLGFAGSVLLGAMAGHLLRTSWAQWKKIAAMVLTGGVCLLLGWIWAGGFGWVWREEAGWTWCGDFGWLGAWRFPIIKHIWTSSMVLWAAGWCYLLLASFYLVVDVLGFRKWAFFFMVLGANSITAYMLAHTVDFGRIADGFVGGIIEHCKRWEGAWPAIGVTLHQLTAFAILWLILLYMYRKRSFVRI